MRLFLITSCCFTAGALAAGSTALEAVKLLPKDDRAKVARIEARDGSLQPERWHILVYDRGKENGVKEFVIAGGEVVAERAISQFAENLTAEEIIGDDVRFDSDSAAKIVERYAQVNDVVVANVAYQLRKDGAKSVPLWRLTCYDRIGREVGAITITATKGAIISHQGFSVEPAPAVAEKPRDKLRTAATTQVVRDSTVVPMREPAVATPIPRKTGLIQRIFGGGERSASQP